jgi:hypothetical protein
MGIAVRFVILIACGNVASKSGILRAAITDEPTRVHVQVLEIRETADISAPVAVLPCKVSNSLKSTIMLSYFSTTFPQLFEARCQIWAKLTSALRPATCDCFTKFSRR